MNEERPNADESAETTEAGGGTADDESRGERRLTDEERAALLKEQLKRLRVIDVVYDMMVQLVQLGYQKLGLTEETRELRNLDDARVAVEALRRLIEVAEGEGDTDVASLHATLAQLQLSYARAAQEGEAAQTPPETAAPQATPSADQPTTRETQASEAETQSRVEAEETSAEQPPAEPGDDSND